MGNTLNAYVEFSNEIKMLHCRANVNETAEKIAKRNNVELTKFSKTIEKPSCDLIVELEFTCKKSDTQTRARINLG